MNVNSPTIGQLTFVSKFIQHVTDIGSVFLSPCVVSGHRAQRKYFLCCCVLVDVSLLL